MGATRRLAKTLILRRLPKTRSRSTRMMATRRSRLRATRRLAKTLILRRLPKTRSRSTRMMATRRSRLRATGRLAKTRTIRTKKMATRPSEHCQSSTAQDSWGLAVRIGLLRELEVPPNIPKDYNWPKLQKGLA